LSKITKVLSGGGSRSHTKDFIEKIIKKTSVERELMIIESKPSTLYG